MENFDINFLSKRIKYNKRKIFESINDSSDLICLSPEKEKKRRKSNEEKFIQLVGDSDSLEEITPNLYKKIEEEEKAIPLTNQIKIIGEGGLIKKRRSFKMRNSSFINIGFSNYKNIFLNEKENKVKDDLNEKKTYTNKKNILLCDSKIIE